MRNNLVSDKTADFILLETSHSTVFTFLFSVKMYLNELARDTVEFNDIVGTIAAFETNEAEDCSGLKEQKWHIRKRYEPVDSSECR
ncbi:MAG: hypothetical protein NC093_10325 [Alistipes sp.]|nr:hypothetical protein [Alistipes sp.]